MDALLAQVLSETVASVVSGAFAGAWRFLASDPAPLPAVSPLVLLDSADPTFSITSSDARRLQKALDGDYATELGSAYVFARLLLADSANPDTEVYATLRNAFIENALRATWDSSWPAEMLGMTWDLYADHLDALVSPDDLASRLDQAERIRLATLDIVVRKTESKAEVQAPRFLIELANALKSPDLLRRATDRSWEVKQAYLQHFTDMRIDHTLDDARRETTSRHAFDSLYIQRSMRTSSAEVSEAGVIEARPRSRYVVTGDPGAGKSTLMQHIVRNLAGSNDPRVPLLVRIREFSQERPVIVDEIAATLRRDLQIHDVKAEELDTILTLGSATVVFDGLDEAKGLPGRRAAVAAIDAFSRRYPLSSYFVTSRSIGYDQAPLGDSFERLTLLEFNDEQILDYARRWFGSERRQRADEAETFYAELESIPDLRSNPLMLSLICTLYRARGFVPRNRRQVYADCADLLFNRWDPMRRIDQPLDQVQHGQDLMQEIALWYFKSKEAQKGVETRQLQGVVEHFFRDSAGVLPSAARQRAASFIEYCSGRAWLLASIGQNSYGERVYTFTHRTFMEYFAAEGLARTSRSVSDLVKHVVSSYAEDSSSVVPELIAQSAEFARRGQGREILTTLKEKEALMGRKFSRRYLALRVRLASVLTLPAHELEPLLVECLEALSQLDVRSAEVFAGMMRMPRDQRSRLVAQLMGDPEVGNAIAEESQRVAWTSALLEWWAYLTFAGLTTQYQAEWTGPMESLYDHLQNSDTETLGPLARLRFWRRDRQPAVLRSDELRASFGVGASSTRGKLAIVLGELIGGGLDLSDQRTRVLADLPRVLTRGSFTVEDAVQYAATLEGFSEPDGSPDRFAVVERLDSGMRVGLCLIALLVAESSVDYGQDEAEAIASVAGFDLGAMTRARSGKGRRSAATQQAITDAIEAGMPEWCRDWTAARYDLIGAATSDNNDDWVEMLRR